MADKKVVWVKWKRYSYELAQPFNDNSCIALVTHNGTDYINGVNNSVFTAGDSGMPNTPSLSSYKSDYAQIDSFHKSNGAGSVVIDYNGDVDFTISGLFYNPTVDSQYNDEFICGNTSISNGSGDLLMSYNKNGYITYKANSGSFAKWYWDANFLNSWHFIALVITGIKGNGTVDLYVDGIKVSSINRGSSDSANTLGLLHLKNPGGYNMGYSNSPWSDFRVFNRALTPGEIKIMSRTLLGN
jgi:hypothetical protein